MNNDASRTFFEMGKQLARLGRHLRIGKDLIHAGDELRKLSRLELREGDLYTLRKPVDGLRALVDDLATVVDALRTMLDTLSAAIGVDN